MSLYTDIAFGRDTALSQAELNRRAKVLADAIEALRAFAPDWQAEVDALRTVGLDRINTALLPAYEQIRDVANLGALLSARSESSVEIGLGPKVFLLPEATRRNFAPTPFLVAAADGNFDTAMVGFLSSYDIETGALVIQVERAFGEGTFTEWVIGPIASTDDLEDLRDQVAQDAQTATNKAEEAVTAAGVATGAAAAAGAAQGASETALGTFQASWYGPRETEPSGAALGAQYLDTSQSPNVVKVLTEAGWAPTVTVSVGGSRQQVYIATDGQTGPFVVDGGFSVGSVNVNGVEFFDGHGVALDADEGEFSFSAPLTAGDLVVFRGYLANDLTDIYTKAESRARFISALDEQAFASEDQAQARENLGLVPTASATDATAGRLLKVGDSATLLSASPALRVTYGGTGDAITLTTGAGISGTPPTGLAVRFRATAANTGATTIALDGGSAVACRTITGVALPAGYVRTNAETEAYFDGTFWVLDRVEERGSNSNGEFVRLAGGTQICTFRETDAANFVTASTADGGIFISATVSLTFAAAFIAAPTVEASFARSSGSFAQLASSVTGSTTVAELRMAAATTGSVGAVRYTATGRWY